MSDARRNNAFYETRVAEIRPGFFKALKDFSNGDKYGGSIHAPRRNIPASLVGDFCYENNYEEALWLEGKDVLKNAYEDSHAHRYFLPSIASLSSLFYNGDDDKPSHEWSELFPEVESIISARGPKVRSAFNTVFEICRACEADNTVKLLQNNDVNRLRGALETIWLAYPETDPYIAEGHDYVMDSASIESIFYSLGFYNGVLGKNGQVYHHLEQKLEAYDGKEPASPQEMAAIAKKYMDNLETLKGYGHQIAVRLLRTYLSNVLEAGGSEETANRIVENLLTRETDFEQEAESIRKGAYGKLAGGYTKWFTRDAERQKAIAIADRAPEFLKVCMEVRSGLWFKEQQNIMTALCKRKRLPGYENNAQSAVQPTMTCSYV